MVNSESMDSPGDGKAKDCITQPNSMSNDSHSPSPVTASSVCLREMDFVNGTADISNTECGSPMDSPPETAVVITTEEESSRLTTETENVEVSGLYCSVPLNKVQNVLNSYTMHLNNNSNQNGSGETRGSSKKLSRSKLLCLYCDRTFVTTNLKQKHVDRCHSIKQARRYSSRFQQTQSTTACIFCNKLNHTNHNLKDLFMHLVDEHSNKYFACVDCEERFAFKSHLEEHDLEMHEDKLLDDLDPVEEARPKLNGAIFFHESEETKIIKTKHKAKIKDVEEITNNSKITVNSNKSNSNNRPNLRMGVRKELRKKKVAVKSTKGGVKRNTRLQTKITTTQTKPMKKRAKAGGKSAEKNLAPKIEINEKSSGCINPYPSFDSFYRVKKITDHSIDNLKISSLTFDDVFDKAFYNRIKCNIQENLQNHIDGKLFKNEESESRISNFEKLREVNSSPAENFGCDLTLNAATPVVSLLSTQFGEDLESQIEYGSKASKKKPSPKKDEVHYKYFTRRKYQASILESKENRDLSKLDMWTQLLVKNRQQKIINDKKTEKEKLEYTKGDEYRTKVKNEELNRILDRRGPFEDLKEEANKKAVMEKLHRLGGSVNCEAITDVTCILNDIIASVFCSTRVISEPVEEEEEIVNVNEEIKIDYDRDFEIPYYLKLRRSSSLIGEPDVDKSDRITLICSSQETENFEECNVPRDRNVLVELSGEWTRSRIYICAACGVKVSNMKLLLEHKSIYHQNVWVQHYEFVGNQSELYRHLSIPGMGKVGFVEDFPMSKVWKRSDARFCTKCSKTCNSLAELHRHVLECGEDWSWMLARRKLKYRPFGAKSRRKRRGLVKRILHSKEKSNNEVREKKKYNIKRIDGPRPKPSDADTIQRMLANLPAKRASRKIISLKDGFPKPMKRKRPAAKNIKQDQKKLMTKTKRSMTNTQERSNNRNQIILRKSVRNINKVFSSKLLDTNSLMMKRKIKNVLQHHRITRSRRELWKEEEQGTEINQELKIKSKNRQTKKNLEEQQVEAASPLKKTRSTQNLTKIVEEIPVVNIEKLEEKALINENINKDDDNINSKIIRSLSLKKFKNGKSEGAKLKTDCENGKFKAVKNGKRKSLGSFKKAIKKIKLREKIITNIVQVDGSSQINDEIPKILPFLENFHLNDDDQDEDDNKAKSEETTSTNKADADGDKEMAETNHIAEAELTDDNNKPKAEEEVVVVIKTEMPTPNITETKTVAKNKVRKRVKGLNDCIAMLTSKLQQKVQCDEVQQQQQVQTATELLPFRPPTPPHSPNPPRPPTPPRSPTPPLQSLPFSPSSLPPPPSFSFPPASFSAPMPSLFGARANGFCENDGKLSNILSGYTFGENFDTNGDACFRNISKLSGLIAAETPTLKDDNPKKTNNNNDLTASKFKEVDVNVEIDLLKCLDKVGESNGQDEKTLKKKKKFNDKRKENINVITRDDYEEPPEQSENENELIKAVADEGAEGKTKKKLNRSKIEAKTIFKAEIQPGLVIKINHLPPIELKELEKPQKKKGRKKKIIEDLYNDMKTTMVEEQEPDLMENKSLINVLDKSPKKDATEASKKVETDSEDEVPLAKLLKTPEKVPETEKIVDETVSVPEENNPEEVVEKEQSLEPQPKQIKKQQQRERVKSNERKKKPCPEKKLKATKKADVYDFDAELEDVKNARKLKISTAIFQTKNKVSLFPAREKKIEGDEEQEEEEPQQHQDQSTQIIQVEEVVGIIKTEPNVNEEEATPAPETEETLVANNEEPEKIAPKILEEHIGNINPPEAELDDEMILENVGDEIPREIAEVNLQEVEETFQMEILEPEDMEIELGVNKGYISTTPLMEIERMTVEALEMKIRRSIVLSNEKLKLEAAQTEPQQSNNNATDEVIMEEMTQPIEEEIIENEQNLLLFKEDGSESAKKPKKTNNRSKKKLADLNRIKINMGQLMTNNGSVLQEDEEKKSKKKRKKEKIPNVDVMTDDKVEILPEQQNEEPPEKEKEEISFSEAAEKLEKLLLEGEEDEVDVYKEDTQQQRQKFNEVLDDSFDSINIEQELRELENKENMDGGNKEAKETWENNLYLDFADYAEPAKSFPEIEDVQKPKDIVSNLKMTISISEISHPVILSTKEQNESEETNNTKASDVNSTKDVSTSDLDLSVSFLQNDENEEKISSDETKTISEVKSPRNNGATKKGKRKRKAKTARLQAMDSDSISTDNQLDSLLQSDSETAASKFKLKIGPKKTERNRNTSLDKLYCDICDKMFVRGDNLVKHRRTLTHIAKLSELEAKEAAEKAKAANTNTNINTNEEIVDAAYKVNINISDILSKPDKEQPQSNLDIAPFMLNTNSDTLKLADIINDVLNKPVNNGNYSEPAIVNINNKEPKRYKSLGERKSFESDINSAYSFNNLHMGEDLQLPKLSTNADSILKHPISISLLENIIENQGPFDYIDDITVSSNKSVEEVQLISRNSPSEEISVLSDPNQIRFGHNANIISDLMKPNDNFVKPTQYEEISNDSSSVRNHFDDPRQRKALNRDEELFLECCSLLKSSSEVSNYSKKSSKNISMINNFEMKPIDEPDWLERKSFNANEQIQDDAFTDSCPNTPLGDGFGDEYSNSNSNTIASDWNTKQKEQAIGENPAFEDISLDNNSKDDRSLENAAPILEQNENHFRIFSTEKYLPEDAQHLQEENFGNEEVKEDVDDDLKKKMVSRFGGLMAKALKNSLQAVKKSKQHRKKQPSSENTQTSITDYVVPLIPSPNSNNKPAESEVTDNKKMLTKGAMKVFEGLKVSIPTDDLDIKELLNGSFGGAKKPVEEEPPPKQTQIETGGEATTTLSKAVKISMKFGNKLGLKVTKKKQQHVGKMKKSPSVSDTKTDKDDDKKRAHDVYDFEETQDNTDIFREANFTNLTAFRNQIIEKKSAEEAAAGLEEVVAGSDSESNNNLLDTFAFETQSISSYSTESTTSYKESKKKKKNITKKKCMIMGRIFKNAFKSKVEDDIRDIPVADNSKLVEDYVMQLPENDKSNKMTEQEMDLLFDKLLQDQNLASSKTENGKPLPEIKQQKPMAAKPKPKPVAKRKRQRQNSESTDDEFSLGKIRKRNSKKKQKNEDDAINLEQELKECIGVASRKSQRKCTSGKQNVLVEFWSSDDSNFEAFLYNSEQIPEATSAVVVSQDQNGENQPNNEANLIITEEPAVEESNNHFSGVKESNNQPPEVDDDPKIPKLPKTTNKSKQVRRKSNAKNNNNRGKVDDDKEDRKLKNIKVTAETLAASRRKRAAADTLYYWSSSSEDESQDLIEVKPIRDEIDEDDDRPIHHGWIVGDSPKKLVTMLAQAKGKKVDAESVKEQGKKRTTL